MHGRGLSREVRILPRIHIAILPFTSLHLLRLFRVTESVLAGTYCLDWGLPASVQSVLCSGREYGQISKSQLCTQPL